MKLRNFIRLIILKELKLLRKFLLKIEVLFSNYIY